MSRPTYPGFDPGSCNGQCYLPQAQVVRLIVDSIPDVNAKRRSKSDGNAAHSPSNWETLLRVASLVAEFKLPARDAIDKFPDKNTVSISCNEKIFRESRAKILWNNPTKAFRAGSVNSSLRLLMNDIQDGLDHWNPGLAGCCRRM